MAKLVIYLLESSVLLALFYLLYLLVLRRETFFNLNRFFLLNTLVVSLLIPLVSIDLIPRKIIVVEQPLKEISKLRMSYYEAMALWEFESNGKEPATQLTAIASKPLMSSASWMKLFASILLAIYAAGILVCLSRTVWTIRWIRKMIVVSPNAKMDTATVIKIRHPIAPFSFFHYVFVHDAIVGTPEFNHILAHERTHIEQRHSIDLVFVQILAAFFWFNPVIWRLIKSLKATHEYIADKKVINSGYSLVEYQTLLLKQLISSNSFGLVHNFNLSFIKKRITMMKNKRSGWSGKLSVAMAIVSSLICGAVIIQCNSKLGDVSLNAENLPGDESASNINMPIVFRTGYVFDGDPNDALTFTIANNSLTIDGQPYQLNEIASVIESGGIPSIKGHVVMHIDKDQKMGFVRDAEMELRKADRRKILYIGRTQDEVRVETPIMLPPTSENALKSSMPVIPEISAVEAEGKTAILKIDAGDNAGIDNQQKVYDFLQKQITKQSADYVVSMRYDNDDTYGVYLPNLIYVKEGFNKLYQERAHQMFGKDYYKVTKEEYQAVRKNLPTSISIAEK